MYKIKKMYELFDKIVKLSITPPLDIFLILVGLFSTSNLCDYFFVLANFLLKFIINTYLFTLCSSK